MLEEECVSAITGVEGNVDAWFRWQQGWILETDWSKSYWWTFKLGETYQIETGQYDTEWYNSSMHGSGERVRANQEPDKALCLVQFVNQLYDKKIGEISSRWDDHGRLEFQQRTPIEYVHAKIKLGDVFDYYTTAAGILQIPEWACFKYAVEHFLENDPRTKYHPSRVREFIEENGLDRLEEME
ncbi:hypothetical protein DVH05_027567 [Phytophthora capsici]|nr:hypothetical protein DVH05_027567 [Phytophthora capsici]